jgi:uncharacterized protein
LSGWLEPTQLPRLADVLFDRTGRLEFSVSGEATAGPRGNSAALKLSVDGMLRLTCQRCLGALEYPVRIRSRLNLVEPGACWPDDGGAGAIEGDDGDAIEAERELDIAALVEDELLLELPIAPRHEDCAVPAGTAGSSAASPFASLARLKRS